MEVDRIYSAGKRAVRGKARVFRQRPSEKQMKGEIKFQARWKIDENRMEKESRSARQKASMVGSRTMGCFPKAKVVIVQMFAIHVESLAAMPGIVGLQFEIFRANFNNRISSGSNSMFLSLQDELLADPLQVTILMDMELANNHRQRPSFVLHVFMNLQMFTTLQMFSSMVKWFLICAVVLAVQVLQMLQSGLCSFTLVMAPVTFRVDQRAPSLKVCPMTAKCVTC